MAKKSAPITIGGQKAIGGQQRQEEPYKTSEAVEHFEDANSIPPPDDQHAATRDYRLKDITIASPSGGNLSVMFNFVSCSIFEDIFSNTMSCELSIMDTNNVVRHLPIIGQQEKLTITFETPGTKDIIEFKFDIYAVRNKILPSSGRKQVVTLSAVSTIMFNETYTKISKSYYDTTTNIIKDICKEYLEIPDKKMFVDVKGDNEKIKIIIPNWSPLTAINWLVARARDGDVCNFVFYEDREGFHLTTLDKLVDVDKPHMGYFYTPRKHRDYTTVGAVRGRRQVGYEYRNIESLVFEEPGNRLDEINGGMHSSRLLTHNIVTKSYEFTDYNMKKEWDNTKHIEKNYPICKDLDKFGTEHDSVFDFKPKHKFLNQKNSLGGEDVEDNDKYQEWFSKRKSQIKQGRLFRIAANLAGDSRRKCGDVVYLKFAPLEPGKNEDESKIDKYITGKYLVTTVRHTLSQDGGYLMDMELTKDSVGMPYPKKSKFLDAIENNKASF